MPRLLLLLPTSTYRTDDFISAAQKLDIDLTVASEEASTFEGRQPGGLLTLDLRHPETAVKAVAQFSRNFPIDAVVGVDDGTAVAAAAIAAALSLPHNPVASAKAAQNKHRMREILSRHAVPVPRYHLFSLNEDPAALAQKITYPCVLKPLILSASRGVIRADDPAQFTTAFRRIEAILNSDELSGYGEAACQTLVEEYIPGTEVALEGLLMKGELRVLALFDKPDPLDGPFFTETIYVTPSRLPADLQDQIIQCAGRAVRALGLREGPVHAELRMNDHGPWVIEIAARSIGGRCSRVLRFGTGMSLEEVILRHALGMEIGSLERERNATGVMMIPIPQAGRFQEVHGLEEARSVPGVEEVSITVHAGQDLLPLPEGSPSYLGFIFARAETPQKVESALRDAYRRLEIIIKMR